MAVKKVVNQVLARRVETKIKTWTWASDGPIHGGGLALNPDLDGNSHGYILRSLSNLITLPQGFTQQTRIGNSVTPKGLTISGLLSSLPWNSVTNNSALPFEVHMVMYRYRVDPDTGDPAYIKQLNAGVVGPISGSALGDMNPDNKDAYVILKKRVWRLKPCPSYQNVSIAAGQALEPVNTTFGSSSNKFFHRFKVRVPLPKKLKFTDVGLKDLTLHPSFDAEANPPLEVAPGTLVPTNFRASIGFYIINGDGNILGTNQVRAKLDLKAALYYTDE